MEIFHYTDYFKPFPLEIDVRPYRFGRRAQAQVTGAFFIDYTGIAVLEQDCAGLNGAAMYGCTNLNTAKPEFTVIYLYRSSTKIIWGRVIQAIKIRKRLRNEAPGNINDWPNISPGNPKIASKVYGAAW